MDRIISKVTVATRKLKDKIAGRGHYRSFIHYFLIILMHLINMTFFQCYILQAELLEASCELNDGQSKTAASLKAVHNDMHLEPYVRRKVHMMIIWNIIFFSQTKHKIHIF